MTNIVAPILKPFHLNGVNYLAGDIFIQPPEYSDGNTVDLHIEGTIGPFDHSLISPELAELLSYPEWVEARRQRLLCPQC